MKPVSCLLICLLSCFLVLLPACGSAPSTESPEDLGRAVAKMLRDNDQKAFMDQAFLGEQDLDCLASQDDQEIKDDAAELRGGKLHKMRVDGNRDWVKTRKKGTDQGVDWSQVEYQGVHYNVEQYKGLSHGDIYLVLKDGDKLWEVRIDDCIKCGDRWFTIDSLRFEGPAE